jgi:hypothetical protein
MWGTAMEANTMFNKIVCSVVFLILTVLAASAQSPAPVRFFHVTSTHTAREDEKTYRTSFDQNIITGTVGNMRYTLEQLASWGFHHFEVGADYPLVRADDKTLKVRVVDKKGRESTESLNVIGVEETGK